MQMQPLNLAHLPRDTRDTLFLLAVIAWVVLPLTAHLPLWCSFTSAALMLWRATLSWQGKALPSKWWLAGLLLAALLATWLSFKTILGRDAGVALLVLLLSLKTLELRARRDAFVVFFLSFFLMLSNFFYSQSLLTASAMLIAMLGLLTALVNAHMPVGKPPLLRAASTAGTLALLGTPVMLLLFLLFPRLAPLWGLPSDAMAGRSGLSASMSVGTIASLALDDSVVLRLRFEGPEPAQSAFYLRGPVLSRFDGRNWQMLDSTTPSSSQLVADLQVQGPGLRYEVTLEPNQRPWLLVLDATPVAPAVSNHIPRMTGELQWLLEQPVSDFIRYRVESYSRFTHGPKVPVLGLEVYRRLPQDSNPRTEALARALKADPGNANLSNTQWAELALTRLRNGGYRYTLEPGLFGQHSADEFWFDRKEGFCEHIASSFVVLMRNLSVPARIVTGYQGGEKNPIDGFWTVRQSDAHAWAEIWQTGQGWLRIDPTSAVEPGRVGSLQRLAAPRSALASALLDNVNPALALNLRAAWEAANNRWNQWVLNYTQARQLDLLKNIGFESPRWEDLVYVLCAIVVLLGLTGAAWSAWERQQQDPWLRLLRKAEFQLQQSGYKLTSNSSARQIAEQLHQQSRGLKNEPAWSAWLLQLEALRYSATPAHSPPGYFKRQLATLQHELKHL
jgi:transglutaminase-like putative cysteine protease